MSDSEKDKSAEEVEEKQEKKESKKRKSSSKKDESDDEAEKPAKKKAKTKKSDDDSAEKFWDLGKNKAVSVSEFKGQVFVNIREYYNDKESGERKPGKKGIALSKEQWKVLKSVISKVDAGLE
jgi:hypothetical protein